MVQKLTLEKADITLGYWGIRGLAQPIRYLLIAADVPFSEVRLGVLQDGTLLDEDKEDEDWGSVRSTLDMPFPNLPYLIDTSGDSPVSLSQSNAILRYLARCYDFYGDSESDRIEIDVLQDEAYDFRNEIIATAYTLGEDYTAKFEHFSTDTLPHYLDSFETYLAGRDSKRFFVGSRLSLVDFVLYELFWQMTLMVPNSITQSNRPTLFAYIKAFEKSPGIANYLQSENHIEHPINMPWASFT
jgi:glutathione S-transferase